MTIGKEKKRAKRDRNFSIFGVVRKYLIREEMGKKGVIKVQNPYFNSINILIRKYIPPLCPLKTDGPKLYVYNKYEYFVIGPKWIQACLGQRKGSYQIGFIIRDCMTLSRIQIHSNTLG